MKTWENQPLKISSFTDEEKQEIKLLLQIIVQTILEA